jgi:hypothetical protein
LVAEEKGEGEKKTVLEYNATVHFQNLLLLR